MNSRPLVIPTEQNEVSLRQLTLEDAVVYFNAVDANREHLSQFEDDTSKKYPTLEEVEKSITSPTNKLRMGIWDEDKFVGSINLTPSSDGKVAEIGYWLDERQTGKGYATVATAALTNYAKQRFTKVHAEVVEGNDASARVLKRTGFHQVGRKGTHLLFDLISQSGPEQSPSLNVRKPEYRDLNHLMPILRTWIRSRDNGSIISGEVNDVINAVNQSILGLSDRQYLIAENENGDVAGIMGMKHPDETMLPFANTDRPIEIINAYVDPAEIGKGIGTTLLLSLEKRAKEQGYKEVIANSGPRNKHSGWDFWTKRYGEPVKAKEFYGNGADAMIWRKSLIDTI